MASIYVNLSRKHSKGLLL